MFPSAADIDSEFKEHLHCLAPTLLAPENLIVKKINGTPLTGRGLLECFKVPVIEHTSYVCGGVDACCRGLYVVRHILHS